MRICRRLEQLRTKIEKAMGQQHRVAEEERMKDTKDRLEHMEAEHDKLLTRALEAEAEVEKQR